MALEKTFTELQTEVNQLHEALHHLSFATEASCPAANELTDRLRDRALKLLGLSMGMLEHAATSKQASAAPADIAELGQGLVRTHVAVNEVAERFWSGVASYEVTGELIMLSQRQDQDWRGWTLGVEQAVERCQAPMLSVMSWLASCWQEILEHATNTAITVKTTNVGPIGMADRWPVGQEVR